jgi:hypothetical protein
MAARNEHIQALGGVVFNTSALEGALSESAAHLLGPGDPEAAMIATSELSTQRLRTVYKAALQHRVEEAELVKRGQELVKQMKGVFEERNRLVHAVYEKGAEDGPFALGVRKRYDAHKGEGLRGRSKEVTLEHLRNTAREAKEQLLAFAGFLEDLEAAGYQAGLSAPEEYE